MGILNKEQLNEYVSSGLTDNEIGKKHGVTRQSIYYLRKRFNIKQTKTRYNNRNSVIRQKYDSGISVKDISKEYKITQFHIYRILKKTK